MSEDNIENKPGLWRSLWSKISIRSKPVPAVELNTDIPLANRTPVDAPPENKTTQEMVKICQKAIVEWTDKDGKLVETYESYRGFIPLARDICAKAEIAKYKELSVHVYLKTVGDTETRTFTIVKGFADAAAAILAKKIIDDPRRVLQQLQLVVGQLFELSELKGIIVTLVTGDAVPGGFGMINDAVEVSDFDIRMLGAAAISQAEQYKDAMRKSKNIEFPGDSRIITATQMPKSSQMPERRR